MIFHLAAGRNDVVYNPDAPELYDKSPVLVGLTGILTAANQCGIASLMVILTSRGLYKLVTYRSQSYSLTMDGTKRFPLQQQHSKGHKRCITTGAASNAHVLVCAQVLQRVKTFFLDYKGTHPPYC